MLVLFANPSKTAAIISTRADPNHPYACSQYARRQTPRRRPFAIRSVPSHGLFRSTLLPAAGPSTFALAATFFPAALSATFFFAAVEGGALPRFLTTVVPVEVLEMLLLLLTDRFAGASGTTGAPRFDLVTASFGAAGGFVALRAGAGLPRASFGSSLTEPAIVAGAATVVSLAGEAAFRGEAGFRGETGRARYDFCGEPNGGRIGENGRVRELEDLGESTVDGLVTCRLFVAAVVLVRFFGWGIWSARLGAFSWSIVDIVSLKMGHQLSNFHYTVDCLITHLFRFTPRTGLTGAAGFCSKVMVLAGERILAAALVLTNFTAFAVVLVLSCPCPMLSMYFASSSPIFAFRRAIGIRLRRNSRRVRRL